MSPSRFRFDRLSRVIDHVQYNEAECLTCGERFFSEGRFGLTGIGELNTSVAEHRRIHEAEYRRATAAARDAALDAKLNALHERVKAHTDE